MRAPEMVSCKSTLTSAMVSWELVLILRRRRPSFTMGITTKGNTPRAKMERNQSR